eukprot:TRINITY_DN5039_c0_g3_i1.p2 TRINITY_DN5039_c0_g3~~TRINITY_DN5039_c0_g3_i1.p2  ORF type:complete len:219 (+),score=48.02 TRINITY_DN5039_c0_g3_i1:147-803(+)
MLPVYLQDVNKLKIVLGSTSFGRRQQLEMVGLKFDTLGSKYDENLPFESYSHQPEEYVKEIARRKLLDVSAQLKDLKQHADVVITGDTLIHYQGKMYIKPKDKEDAFAMLKTLCGHTHQCISAVWIGILNSNQELIEAIGDVVATNLTFRPLTDAEIRAYVDTGESLNNSGSYMIDGNGATLIEKLEGCYYAVCGLPLGALASIMIPALKKHKLIPDA